MNIADSHVIIIGGTKGIGHATAAAALDAGARVTITGRSAETVEAARGALPGDPAGAMLDFTDPGSVAAFAGGVDAADHLVLSASSDVAWGPFGDLTEEGLKAAFEAKFWGYWRVAHALAAKLSRSGSVTFVTGAAARAALPGTSGLAAVNGAIEAMSKVLAAELAPLRVNTVSPGLTDTEAYAGMPREAREALFSATAEKLPAGRIGTAEDIAAAVLFSLSNPYLTGATLDIDGGAHLAR